MQETSATFGQGVLSVYNGRKVIANLPFAAAPSSAAALVASGFQVSNYAGDVLTTYNAFGAGGGVTAAAPGAPIAPILPPAPRVLPSNSATDVSVTNTTVPPALAAVATATQRLLDGYTVHLGSVYASQPSVNIASVTFG